MIYTLPFPPSVNRHVRADFTTGRVLVSRAWRDYRAVVGKLIMASGLDQPLTGRVSVAILARMPDKRRRDLDNYLKVLLDSLSGIVYVDDSQIDFLSIKREYAEDKVGQLIVEVSLL
jgi:crossover junction endodeoxyribonuclease RusA